MILLRACRLLGSLVLALLVVGPCLALAHVTGRGRLAGTLQVALCQLLLGGLRVEVSGELALAAPTLVVANHVSWLDVLAIGSRTPACFLAKREVGGWPLVGLLARRAGTVFVDRARRRSILPANNAIEARLANGGHVVLFAEGTTSDGAVLPFRTSHLASLRSRCREDDLVWGAAVLPVAIGYSHPVAAWVGEESLAPHLLRVLAAPPLRCTLRAGEARTVPSGFDRKALGRALRAEVCFMLSGVPDMAAVIPMTAAPPRPPPAAELAVVSDHRRPQVAECERTRV